MRAPNAAPALLGRDAQLRDVADALARSRFITLTGPGGVGKTSLARALAQQTSGDFPDGVWFAELAPQRDLAGVIGTLHAALNVQSGFAAPSLGDLQAHLQPKRALLVLDNCEHVLHAASYLAAALYAGAPNLSIVATSRQALGCAGEHVIHVLPLALPDAGVNSLRHARRSPAFRLFMDRINALDPRFRLDDEQVPTVVRICRSLDGLPLTLEMVAGWAGALGLEALEKKLDASPLALIRARVTETGRDHAGLLHNGLQHNGLQHAGLQPDGRHHDLRSTLGWSHDLLSPAEQALLRRVAVFAQDFTLGAAEEVAAYGHLEADEVFAHLTSLVQKSLVAVTPGRRVHSYRLLDTTRAFALEKLREAADEHAARTHHALYVLRVLTASDREIDSSRMVDWLASYAPLIQDVRRALDWTIAQQGDPATGMAIAASSWQLWRELSLRVEGARWIEAALQHVRPDTPTLVEAQLRYGLGMLHCQNHSVVARGALEDAARLFRQIGERARLGAAQIALAFLRFELGDIGGAEQAVEEGCALLEGSGSRRVAISVLGVRMVLHAHHHRYDEARAVLRQAERLHEAMGAERSALTARINMVELAVCQGDVETAIAEGRPLAARLRATSHGGILGFLLINLVAALVRAGHFDESLATAQEAAPLLPERLVTMLIDHLALGCAMRGQMEDAATLAGFANRAHRDRGWPRQSVEQYASDRLQAMLAKALPGDVIAGLAQHGALLSEAAAWSIAVAEDSVAGSLPRAS